MNVKHTTLILLTCAAASMLVFSRCANVSRGPSGGPKDTIPPVVLKSNPKSGATNFAGKTLEIELNEYPKLKDAKKEFTMSPPLAIAPTYRTKGKTVRVEFGDTLLSPNTTYLLDFGNSITDNNEGNPLKGYQFTFSTGASIDSANISGRVLDAFTLEPVEGSMVFLYENNIDSLPYTKLPNAIAKTSKRGFFIAGGLKKGTSYKLVAVEDKNQNNKYNPDAEKIGFLDELVQAGYDAKYKTLEDCDKDSTATPSGLTKLGLFSENTKKQFLDSYKHEEERRVVLTFAQREPEIKSLTFEGIDSSKIIREHSFWNDTLTCWLTSDTIPKALKGKIVYMRADSLNNVVPYSADLKFEELKEKPKEKEDKDKPKKTPTIQLNVLYSQDRVTEDGLSIKLPAPLTKLDEKKIKLYKFRDLRDTVKTPMAFTIEKSSKNLCIYNIQAKWETTEAYLIQIDSLAMQDIYGLVNGKFEKRIETPNSAKYAVLSLSVSNVSGSYIAQLVKDKKTLQEKLFSKDGVVKFSFVPAGAYEVRIIQDENANGRWDEGSYLQHRQPESVIMLKMPDGTNKITLKQNWDNELKVDIKQQFTAPKE